jgi:hypothetical protein
MVSYKNLFLIKGMTYWNGVTDWFRRTRTRVCSWYESILEWFDPHAGTWYITPGGIFPLPHAYQYGYHGKDTWRYHPETGELVYGDDSSEKKEYKIAWLSARVTSIHVSKDMDGFLADLRIQSKGHDLPLSVFLQAWSLYDHHWWSADSSVQIEWIDRMAEEHSATVMEAILLPLLPSSPSKN